MYKESSCGLKQYVSMHSFNGKKQREKSVLKESNMATVNTKRSVAKKSKYRMNGYSRNASVIKVSRFLNIYSLKAFFPYRVGFDIQVNSLLICRFWSSESHIVLSVFELFMPGFECYFNIELYLSSSR